MTYFHKTLAVDPKFERALDYKAVTLDRLGNYTGAITYFDKALAIDPHDKFALSGLAQSNRYTIMRYYSHTNRYHGICYRRVI
jgi:tetratricopeptide (TPR) repeat protein